MGKRILLVTPPRYKGVSAVRLYRCECLDQISILPPLDLAYFSSILKQRDCLVRIIDGNAENITYQEFQRRCVQFDPDTLIIKGVLNILDHDLQIAREMKQHNPDIETILCSMTCIGIADWILDRYPYVDAFARGEIDAFAEEICLRKLSHIEGMVTKEKREARIRIVEDLDSLPFPDWDQLPEVNFYHGVPDGKLKPWFMLISSRGCPFNCSFCTVGGNTERAFRYRSRNAKNVVDELEALVDRFGLKSFLFFDETFTIPGHCEAICQEMINRRLTGIPWACNGRTNLVNRDMLKLMKKAGCFHIDYGIESGSDSILSNVAKGESVSDTKKAIKSTQKAGIRPGGSVVIGLPGETWWTFLKTLWFYFVQLRLDAGLFGIAIPYPGTRLFDLCRERALITTYDWNRYDQYCPEPPIKTEKLSSQDLARMQSIANKALFVRFGFKMMPSILTHPWKLKDYVMKYMLGRGWSRTSVDDQDIHST